MLHKQKYMHGPITGLKFILSPASKFSPASSVFPALVFYPATPLDIQQEETEICHVQSAFQLTTASVHLVILYIPPVICKIKYRFILYLPSKIRS